MIFALFLSCPALHCPVAGSPDHAGGGETGGRGGASGDGDQALPPSPRQHRQPRLLRLRPL